MSCIVYQTDRRGNRYAYESTSYWDKEKGQPRSKENILERWILKRARSYRQKRQGCRLKVVKALHSPLQVEMMHC